MKKRKFKSLGTVEDPFSQLKRVEKKHIWVKERAQKKVEKSGNFVAESNFHKRGMRGKCQYLTSARTLRKPIQSAQDRLNAINDLETIKLYNVEGYTIAQIARHYKVSPPKIRAILLQSGVLRKVGGFAKKQYFKSKYQRIKKMDKLK